MTTCILNCCQACWSLFLSKYNFKLTWGPGIKNVANGPSCQLDFALQEGDDARKAMSQAILTDKHTKNLFSPDSSSSALTISTLSALTTLAVDSSDQLEGYKSALEADDDELGVRGGGQVRADEDLDAAILEVDDSGFGRGAHDGCDALRKRMSISTATGGCEK